MPEVDHYTTQGYLAQEVVPAYIYSRLVCSGIARTNFRDAAMFWLFFLLYFCDSDPLRHGFKHSCSSRGGGLHRGVLARRYHTFCSLTWKLWNGHFCPTNMTVVSFTQAADDDEICRLSYCIQTVFRWWVVEIRWMDFINLKCIPIEIPVEIHR